MADSRADYVFKRQSQLENDRSTWEAHWREIAERVLPRQDDFQKVRTPGEKRTEKIFDATAPLALDRAASAIDSLITPATQQYHGLQPVNEKLLANREVMIYLAEVTKTLFRMRYRPDANFPSQSHECYVSLMAFGTLGMFTDDVMGVGLRYKSIPLAELYIAENHAGMIDYQHRKFPLSARAALQRFKAVLPEKIAKEAETNPFRKFDFIHCVKPNEEQKRGERTYRGMPWTSYYVSYEGHCMLEEGGYRTNPYAVSRHVTAPRETYGRSPAMMVLPDIKMVNEMEKTTIRAAHKIVDPPLLVYGDGILSAFNARPNAINYGAVDEQGRQLVHPMKTGSNLPIVFEMTEQKRKLINDAFYVTLFQILVQNPQMTATEALLRAQEKGQLLAPTIGRQQSEFLGNMIRRELDVGEAAGQFPPMPDALREAGGFLAVKVVYTSPLSRLRRSEDAVAILRWLEGIGPITKVKPSVMDIIDDDEVVRELADIGGVPIKCVRPRAVVEEMRAREQQQQQQASLLEGADTAASAAKKMAQAAQAAGFVVPATPG